MASARISTRNLAALPAPARLRQIGKALALLDATFTPDPQHRVYSYQTDPAGELAYMQSHSGDMFSIWFDDNGAVIRGFELHSPLGHPDRTPSEDDLFHGLPDSLFPGARGDYAGGGDDLTFVLWCGTDDRWCTGRLTFGDDEDGDPDGSETCLWMLADDRDTFMEFAMQRWRTGREHEAELAALFEMQPVTAELITRLAGDADVPLVTDLARAIEWPVGS
jgi:hypothetical protein